jgi:hypothetical protein
VKYLLLVEKSDGEYFKNIFTGEHLFHTNYLAVNMVFELVNIGDTNKLPLKISASTPILLKLVCWLISVVQMFTNTLYFRFFHALHWPWSPL